MVRIASAIHLAVENKAITRSTFTKCARAEINAAAIYFRGAAIRSDMVLRRDAMQSATRLVPQPS